MDTSLFSVWGMYENEKHEVCLSRKEICREKKNKLDLCFLIAQNLCFTLSASTVLLLASLLPFQSLSDHIANLTHLVQIHF